MKRDNPLLLSNKSRAELASGKVAVASAIGSVSKVGRRLRIVEIDSSC